MPEVRRQRHEIPLFEESDHLVLAAFVGLQELLLVLGDGAAAGRVRIGQGRIGEERLEGPVTGQLGLAEHLDLPRVEWQQIRAAQELVVIRLTHRLERRHLRQPLLQPVGEAVHGGNGGIGRLDEFVPLAGLQVGREGRQAVLEQGVDGAGGVDGEPGVEADRPGQVRLALLQEHRHRLQPGRGRQRPRARGSVLLLQERKDRVAALVDVELGVGRLRVHDAAEELDRVDLRAEQEPVSTAAWEKSARRSSQVCSPCELLATG